ncbi:MAG TPA: DUF4384 domain-containing protein [Candidatus Sumerlaeota bacterium]|nr:DUF4384 domain-containing protein [Candidatus Sumerlaeota bacterium]HPS00589.1 DUF4384 domain-containing protein [Candidatus Sumerlaeota bacterium]
MLTVPQGYRGRWSALCLGVVAIGLCTGCFKTFSIKTAIVVEHPETQVAYENPTLPKAERYRLELTANRECYLYVVRETPDGQVNLLMPATARRAGDNRLQPESPRAIPGTDMWIEGTSQEGADLLTVLATDRASSELDALRYRQDLKHEDIVSVLERLRAQHMMLQKPATEKITSEGLLCSRRYSKKGNLVQYEIKIVRN